MKNKIVIIIIIILILATGGFLLYKNFSNKQSKNISPNPSPEEIAQGIKEKDEIRNSLSNIINGNEGTGDNSPISIAEARNRAIIIFESLGETDLNKDNVSVIEEEIRGKKYYYIQSRENTAEVEIETGRFTRINMIPQ